MKLRIIGHKQGDLITLQNKEMDEFSSSYKLFKMAKNLKKREIENSYPTTIEFEINPTLVRSN